jgi:hypothetical protein
VPRDSTTEEPHDEPAAVPRVKLGRVIEGGLAPAILAIVERGAHHRPRLARSLRGEIELAMDDHPPVRIVGEDGTITVEDGSGGSPDLRVTGTLSDLTAMMAAPMIGGLPSPVNSRGRAALAMVASRRVQIDGRLALLRRLLGVIRV